MAYVNDKILLELFCRLDNCAFLSAYKTTLPDVTSFSIYPNIHKLAIVHGYLFLSPTGEETGVLFTLQPDKSVKLESNISMFNYTIILF